MSEYIYHAKSVRSEKRSPSISIEVQSISENQRRQDCTGVVCGLRQAANC